MQPKVWSMGARGLTFYSDEEKLDWVETQILKVLTQFQR